MMLTLEPGLDELDVERLCKGPPALARPLVIIEEPQHEVGDALFNRVAIAVDDQRDCL